jgi:hypothetical protein
MATLLMICDKCGYKQFYLKFNEGAVRTVQAVFSKHPELTPCPKCKGDVKMREIPFKDIIRLTEKFPLKKVVRTFKSVDDLMVLDDDWEWVKSSYPDEPTCPKCGKPLCLCGDPEETHCSDSKCGWIDNVQAENQI